MSYIPKYLMDRMFNGGGVELNGTTLLITMNAMLRPINKVDIGDVIVKVMYEEIDTDETSLTYNELITKIDEYTIAICNVC